MVYVKMLEEQSEPLFASATAVGRAFSAKWQNQIHAKWPLRAYRRGNSLYVFTEVLASKMETVRMAIGVSVKTVGLGLDAKLISLK